VTLDLEVKRHPCILVKFGYSPLLDQMPGSQKLIERGFDRFGTNRNVDREQRRVDCGSTRENAKSPAVRSFFIQETGSKSGASSQGS